MIALLSGTIVTVQGQTVTIDVAGVGYEVNCSRRCTERLEISARAQLVIYTEVREDALKLYGFADALEKQVFLLLTKVKGVGAKSASEIVSHIDKTELLRVIGSGDLPRLQSVRGIGKKTAERILVELRDRVEEYVTDSSADRISGSVALEPFADALQALQALGFPRRDAERALSQVRAHGGGIENSGAIVKEALKFV